MASMFTGATRFRRSNPDVLGDMAADLASHVTASSEADIGKDVMRSTTIACSDSTYPPEETAQISCKALEQGLRAEPSLQEIRLVFLSERVCEIFLQHHIFEE